MTQGVQRNASLWQATGASSDTPSRLDMNWIQNMLYVNWIPSVKALHSVLPKSRNCHH